MHVQREPRIALNPLVTRLLRALGASLLLLVIGGAGVAAAADIGHEDFGATTGGAAITGSKPESKLWYNDGAWWASMWSTSPAGFYIYKLDTGNDTWARTPTRLDDRPGTRADTLWDGAKLYVASQVVHEDGGATGSGSGFDAELYRFSYNRSNDTYTIDPGFPATIRSGIRSETLVIAKDSTGTLWATWTLKSGGVTRVYTNHTVGGDDGDWAAPAELIAGTKGQTKADDISSIIAFAVSGERRIGVFWSNQDDKKDYFAWQPDGGPDDDWMVETAVAPVTSGSNADPLPADDHMNLKTDSSGKVYVVTKTSNTASAQPLIQLLVRSTGGTWTRYPVGRVSDSNTRAILELDTAASELHVFMTGPHNGSGSGQEGGDIVEKVSDLSPIDFSTGAGTAVIRDDSKPDLNNVTSTKQNLNDTTGIVVLAFNDNTNRYWHHRETLPPNADFTGSPTSGNLPLTVAFADASTGTVPLTFAWNFGDPASGSNNTSALENPTHTYDTVGTYTVKLTVTNAAGTKTKTRTGYITVTEAPVAGFTAAPTAGIAPLTVTFANTSTGTAPLTYAWDFGDPASGTNDTSALRNPVHTYNPGTYTVRLTVTNDAGTDTRTRTGYVVVSAPPGSRFHSISPVRVLDSRIGLGLSGVFHANAARDFIVADGSPIPTDAVAVTGNLTVTGQTRAGYVVLAPASGGSTSTLNFPVGDSRANGVTVALGAGGKLNAVYKATAGATTHLVFDVTGYFANDSGGSRFHSISPVRVLDSRIGLGLSGVFHANAARDFIVADGSPIPTDAVAVTGNLTVTGQTRAGYVVLAPASGGSTSTLNFPVGDSRANGVTVALGAGGKLNAVYKATAGATTHLVFDVTGYFLAGPSGANFFALVPQRRLDSRTGIGLSGAFHANAARDFIVADGSPIPTDAVAVTGNLTVTGQTRAGYVVLAPAAGGSTSTLNFPVGDTRANGTTVALGSSGKLDAVYKATAGAKTQLVFDVTGYFR